MSATAIRQWVGDVIRVEGIHAAITSGPTIPERETAQRLEDKLAEEQDIFILAASETGISFRIRPPRLSLESTAVMSHVKDQRSRGDGATMDEFNPESQSSARWSEAN